VSGDRKRGPPTLSAPRGAPWRAELVDPPVDGRWEAFVAASPGAAVFHHRAWLGLLQRTYGCPITACCLVDASSKIRAGVPLALVRRGRRAAWLTCLPLTARCSTLPSPDDDADLAGELIAAVDDLRRSLQVPVELRGPVAAHPSAWVSARYHAHRITLEHDADRVLLRSRRRAEVLRGAHRSREDGLVVERRTDARALADLYRLYVAERRRHGAPSLPRRFVLGLAHVFDHGLGFVLLVRSGEQLVAGAVLLSFNDTLIYQLGARGPGATSAVMDLVLLEAIRWGCDAGMHTLDLGRTELSDAGPREFNLSWGARESVLAYHQLRDQSPARERTGGSWTRPLIRHSPSAVGRVLGEALCR
jgi:hypothetical protein